VLAAKELIRPPWKSDKKNVGQIAHYLAISATNDMEFLLGSPLPNKISMGGSLYLRAFFAPLA
jgi:hypothetical protein